ncbi:MAG: hypothetical protein WC821_02740 [archaeon]|jgi:hypothetical protein
MKMIESSPAWHFQIDYKSSKEGSIMEPFFSKEMTPDLAEICGIHAGDGHLRKRDNVRRLLCLDGSVDEKEYYDTHVVPLFERTFGIKVKPRFFPSRHTYGFSVSNRKVCGLIHSLGFPYGKKTVSVKVPEVILQSNDLGVIYRFIRGVFDTDGTVCFRRRKRLRGKSENANRHTYPRILLDVCSKDLCFGLGELLLKTGVFRFNISSQRAKGNRKKKYKLCIAGDKNLLLWVHNIGFKNNVKHNRILIWDKFGFNPPKLTLNHQLEILSGKIDPNIFYKDGEFYHEREESVIARNKQLLRKMIEVSDT